MDLIADIGATNSRCALVDDSGRVTRSESYRNADFSGLEAVLAHFIAGAGSSAPGRAALAIAAPLAGDEVAMTNIGWRFSRNALQQTLGLEALHLLNDFEALAHALPLIGPADCHRVGSGRALPGAAMAVLGPGSGLGVAAVVADGDGWTAVAGEGGHVSVPAMSSIETEIIREHGESSGHCSAETLLSGPGLVRIHSTLCRLNGGTVGELTPAAISDAALAGEERAVQTCEVFFAILGTIAGNLALTVGARGGVFVAGGIVPRLLERFERSAFRERFVAKGRYRGYLDAIPTAVITRPNPAFVGLAAVLARSRTG
jgi:glucokinase